MKQNQSPAARYIPPFAAPFSPSEAKPAARWLADWLEARDYIDENIGEHEAQYRSECAMFGDAGPGQGYWLAIMKADYARCEALAARLLADEAAASDARTLAYIDAAEQAYFDF